jgi:hypothetical protein
VFCELTGIRRNCSTPDDAEVAGLD